MADPAKYLLPTERPVINIRRHWAVLAAEHHPERAAAGPRRAAGPGPVGRRLRPDGRRLLLRLRGRALDVDHRRLVRGEAGRHRQAGAAGDRHRHPQRGDHAAGQGHRPDVQPVGHRADARVRAVRRGDRRSGPGAQSTSTSCRSRRSSTCRSPSCSSAATRARRGRWSPPPSGRPRRRTDRAGPGRWRRFSRRRRQEADEQPGPAPSAPPPSQLDQILAHRDQVLLADRDDDLDYDRDYPRYDRNSVEPRADDDWDDGAYRRPDPTGGLPRIHEPRAAVGDEGSRPESAAAAAAPAAGRAAAGHRPRGRLTRAAGSPGRGAGAQAVPSSAEMLIDLHAHSTASDGTDPPARAGRDRPGGGARRGRAHRPRHHGRLGARPPRRCRPG